MTFQLTLASFICILLATCSSVTDSIEKKSPQDNKTQVKQVDSVIPIEKELNNNPRQLDYNLQKAIAIKRDNRFFSSSDLHREQNRTQKPNSSSIQLKTDSEPDIYQSAISSNYMTLEPTGQVNRQGNPFYSLNLYINGKLFKKYLTVTGRAYSQNRDRQRAGTKAPLPDGRYSVSFATVPGSHVEVGGRFLPIQPLFATNRTSLGIHYDPSFEKSNGEDGTSGCIALTNKSDFQEVINYVYKYQPQYLTVDIQ